jgi:hypothetical protein
MNPEKSPKIKKPKQTTTEKRMAAEERVKLLRAKEKAEAARKAEAEAKIEKKNDTRRRILLGSMALKLMRTDDRSRITYLADLDKYLTREDERRLFELPWPRAAD